MPTVPERLAAVVSSVNANVPSPASVIAPKLPPAKFSALPDATVTVLPASAAVPVDVRRTAARVTEMSPSNVSPTEISPVSEASEMTSVSPAKSFVSADSSASV